MRKEEKAKREKPDIEQGNKICFKLINILKLRIEKGKNNKMLT